jgi:hypothetical protein
MEQHWHHNKSTQQRKSQRTKRLIASSDACLVELLLINAVLTQQLQGELQDTLQAHRNCRKGEFEQSVTMTI